MKLIELSEYDEQTHNTKYVIKDGNVEYVTNFYNFNDIKEVRNCGNECSYLIFKDNVIITVSETVEDIEELLMENSIEYTLTLDEDDEEFSDNNFSIQLVD